jgi:hypothetical protein
MTFLPGTAIVGSLPLPRFAEVNVRKRPDLHGVYGHITPAMRAELRTGLQELWERPLHERSRLAARSAVTVLDGLLAPLRGSVP